MIQKLLKKQSNSILAIATAVLLAVVTLVATVLGDAALSGTINVTGLTANSSGATDWTASANKAVWEGKTTASSGCNPTYTSTSGKLELTNDSGMTKELSFGYELTLDGGSFEIDGTNQTTDGTFTFSKVLKHGETVTLNVSSVSSSSKKEGTTKVTLSNIKLSADPIAITFKSSTNGTYRVNGGEVSLDKAIESSNITTFALAATPASGYGFAGWYHKDAKTELYTLISDSATLTAQAFSTSGEVSALFLPSEILADPLYKQAKVPGQSRYTKDQLVSIDSYYLHDATETVDRATGSHSVTGLQAYKSAYSKTATAGDAAKDNYDIYYVPSLSWNNDMAVSASGNATGDKMDSWKEETFAHARFYADVIRIYAKENCSISFDYTNGFSSNTKETGVYCYITSSPSASVQQIVSGSTIRLTETSGESGTFSLSKGNYLYIVVTGYAQKYGFLTMANMEYNYSATISNFSVSYNEKKDVLSAGFRDNTGKVLTSGQILVNNVGQSIGSNGNMTDMTFADLAFVELKVGSVPVSYVHIGWTITPKGGSTTYQYTPTYNCTLTEDVTVNALFSPKMTITMGANGYADATYTLFDGTVANGQYVARNAACTEYYTSLADAFSKTDKVVLLAGDTLNGDWSIPAGKTFVIPYGMNDAGSTTPTYAYGMGADYCLVNLNGNLTVNGTLIVSAQQNQSTGATGGNPGHLAVAAGKTITVSGSLYAYGPVTGSGKVEAASTAKIHETLEFSDNTVVIYIYNIYNEKSSKKVFPFNTMFINSIEIPVTYQLGATLTAHVAIKYDTVCAAEVPLIASSGAMMNHTAGTITKYFDHATGQFVFRFNEGSEVSTGAFSITMDVVVASMAQSITMNSEDYYLPLSAPFRFEVAGDLTINGKYKLLPGMTVDVRPSGTLTIADGSEVILYRRNDYDYRGKHANSTDQWGFSEKVYPLNPQRYNGVTYSFTFSNSNMGSAKLNVDGTLVVEGGLYVTNQLMTEGDGISYTADGYNYLTGYGTIDMTGADKFPENGKVINEVLRASSTNTLAWTTVAVVPVKGLRPDATANEASQYESLTGKSGGVTNSNGLNVWLTGAPELNVAYRLNDYLWFNGYFTEDYIVNPTKSIGLSGNSVQTAVSNGKRYVVKAIPADEIPDDLTFTLTFTAPDGATYSRTFIVNLATYNAGNDEELKQALLAYGDAAKDYFGGVSVSAPEKPALKNGLTFQEDAQTMGNLSISTSGATIYFDEAIRVSVKYALNAGENVVIDEVNKTITIDGITYSVVQAGVLLNEMGFAEDGQTWSWNGETLTTVNGMACLTFNVPEITAPEGYLPNQPNVPADPDNPNLKLPGDTMVNEFAVSGEATFNLTAGQYLKGFSLRAFAVLQDAKGDYHCIYGKQYGYGLEAYINRTFGTNGNAFDKLLIETWNLAQVAG